MSKRNNRYKFELYRKCFHIASLIIPFLYYTIPEDVFVVGFTLITTFIVLIDISRHYIPLINSLNRYIFGNIAYKSEINGRRFFTGITYLFIGKFCTVVFFAKQICITSWIILGISDVISGLINKHLNFKKKHFISGIGFLLSSIFIGHFCLHNIFSSWIIILSCCITSLTEFYSCQFNIDDNLSIPISFCSMITLLINIHL